MRRHIHRYPSYTPIKATPTRSVSEDMEYWSKQKDNASKIEMKTEEEPNRRIRQAAENCLATDGTTVSDPDDGVHFTLKTNAGTLSYKPSEYSNYTDFLRVIFEMSLTFNAVEVDPEFRKVMKKAFAAYEGTEDFDDEDDSDDEYDNSEPEDIDFVPNALENARNEADKWEKGIKYIGALPKSETLTLKILQSESESTNTRAVEKLLMKMTDLPPNIMHAVVHKNQAFSLPFQKASDVYVQLRMLGIPLTVKSGDVDAVSTTITKSAAKKSVKKTTTKGGGKKTTVKKRTSVKKKPITKKISAKKRSTRIKPKSQCKVKPIPNGSEKLRAAIGIIKSE
jgi:hypothetical protein